MKKHMQDLLKMDTTALTKKRGILMTEIIETKRGIINGEIQNTQLAKIKRQELARVNTLLNTSSNLGNTNPTEVKAVAKKPINTKTKETK